MFEYLEDIPEMRPGIDPLDDWYAVKDLRENNDRQYLGLDPWQADFPRIPKSTETTEQAVNRLLSYFV